jgi:DNA polymerase type B, organellar and viral
MTDKTHHKKIEREFVAIDGEGQRVFIGHVNEPPESEHRYVLIGIGQEQIANPSGLHWTEIFDFLYWEGQQCSNDTAFVGFFLGYDFTQWFKSLPQHKAWRLLTKEGIASRRYKNGKRTYAVKCRNWQFDILGNKRFRFRPTVCDCETSECKCPDQNSWMYICDTGPYFQKAFLSVIDPKDWPEGTITKEEYEEIKRGKGERSSAHLGPEMMRYNRLENEVLARIMHHLDDSFKKIGINLKRNQWFGPGQAAQEWLKGRAPKREEILGAVPEWFLEAARMSYYGGWFEIFVHGLIPGISYEYDVNSAYPYIIASLPCLLHGIYERGIGKPDLDLEQKEICLVRARVSAKGTQNSRYSGTLPYRNKKGGICRPLETAGIYWHHEIEAAKRAGCIGDIQYFEWFKYTPCNCPPPLADVESLYDLRLQVGKNTPFGMACRLVYNSMYGKFAQSVGDPLFGNSVYASLITAGCRTMILDAIATHPNGWKDVLMVATDGVYFYSKHPTLEISPRELGKWDEKEKPNLTLFKPGVYWDDKARDQIDKGESPNFKARGVSARDFATSIVRIDYEFASWKDALIEDWPSVTYTPQFNMTTALQALIQHDWSLAGLVRDDREMTQNAWPGDKRYPTAYYDEDYEIYRSVPRKVDDIETTPYMKRFGMTSEEASEIHFTLEWMEKGGITPDEWAGDSFVRTLTGKDE